MISKQTVLILGAGASVEYGYPLAIDLKKEILKKLQDTKVRVELKEWYGYSDFLLDNFALAFSQSGVNNIEDFILERNEFEEVGKLVLAKVLLEIENTTVPFKDEGWYQYLFNVMNDSFESFGQNNLSVITFNFDRSLEIFLYEALRNSYGKSHVEILSTLKNIPIIHIPGQVGNIPWQGTREQDTQISRTELLEATKGINIVQKLEINVQIQELLNSSEVIAFLGFGYDESSMKSLGISNLEDKIIMGSTFGLKPGEIKLIAKKSNGKITFPKTKIAQALDVKGFLKESGILGM